MLASPVTHELLELRRRDVAPEELRHNWFTLPYAEMLYANYLELDTDQNGLLSAAELSRYRGGGLTKSPHQERRCDEPSSDRRCRHGPHG